MHTMAEKMEAMQQHAECPPSWWEFANIHATHVYNRVPMDRSRQNGGLEHNWLTPIELLEPLIGKPSTKHFCVWGCGAYVYIPTTDRANKFHPKSVLMTYIGYGPSGHMFITKTGGFRESPHVIFDENMFPCRKVDPHDRPPKQNERVISDTENQSEEQDEDTYPGGDNGDDDDMYPDTGHDHRHSPIPTPTTPHRRSPSPPLPRRRDSTPSPTEQQETDTPPGLNLQNTHNTC
jgi:hypothetical protein